MSDFVTVQKGMTLSQIAKANGTTVKELQQLNGIKNANIIIVGQKIYLPGKGVTIEKAQSSQAAEEQYKKQVETQQRELDNLQNKDVRVKRGDTLSKIAAKYGTTVDELKRLNGIENPDMIRVGQTIKLPKGNAATTKESTPTPTSTINESKSTETRGVESKNQAQKPSQSAKTQQTAPKSESSADIPEVQEEILIPDVVEIYKKIEKSGHRPQLISDLKTLPKEQQEFLVNEFRSWSDMTIIRDETTGYLHAFFENPKVASAKKLGLKSCEYIITNDKLKDTATRYYTNGKIVRDSNYIVDGEIAHRADIIQHGTKPPVTKKSTKDPYDIVKIEVDPKLLAGATAKQKERFNDLLKGLMSQKASLMKDLNLDNETYHQFVKLAIGIAIQEQGLDTGLSKSRWLKKTSVGQAVYDTLAIGGIAVNTFFGANATTAVSKGLTSVKVGDWNDDPKIKKLFDKYGIGNGYYNNQMSGAQSAAATIIILNELQNKVRNNKEFQDGIEAANGRICQRNIVLQNGQEQRLGTAVNIVNYVSETDAMLYLYNGRRTTLERGNALPLNWEYSHNVNRFMNGVKVLVNKKQHDEAQQNATTVSISSNARIKSRASKNLSGAIGQVAFKAKLYTKGIKQNNEKEIKLLIKELQLRGVSNKLITNLVNKMKNGDITFVNGLTKSEIQALTENDIKLMLDYSNKLDAKLKSISSIEQKRKIASSYDKAFKKAYLNSHAQKSTLSLVKNSTITLNSGNSQRQSRPPKGYYTAGFSLATKHLNSFLLTTNRDGSEKRYVQGAGLSNARTAVANGYYRGFMAEKDKGVNESNASPINILLAQNASDVANTINTSGQCVGGTKLALMGAGLISNEERAEAGNEGSKLAAFLEKHPDRFREITHVQISSTLAREITAGDISSLPAGCIVVFGNGNFVSEKGERVSVPGHAGITSGNGQIYSDEVDNSNWDNFASLYANQNGKGEHGWVRVFIPNPDYYTISADGNKVCKK